MPNTWEFALCTGNNTPSLPDLLSVLEKWKCEIYKDPDIGTVYLRIPLDQEFAVEWVILTVVGVVVLVFVISQLSKGIRPSPRATRGSSRLSAAEILSRVQALRDANAQWDAIWSQLNPSGDPEVQQLLIEIRGPHMFAPHLGLGVIEDGCERVLASSPAADALAALREAIRRADPFVR